MSEEAEHNCKDEDMDEFCSVCIHRLHVSHALVTNERDAYLNLIAEFIMNCADGTRSKTWEEFLKWSEWFADYQTRVIDITADWCGLKLKK